MDPQKGGDLIPGPAVQVQLDHFPLAGRQQVQAMDCRRLHPGPALVDLAVQGDVRPSPVQILLAVFGKVRRGGLTSASPAAHSQGPELVAHVQQLLVDHEQGQVVPLAPGLEVQLVLLPGQQLALAGPQLVNGHHGTSVHASPRRQWYRSGEHRNSRP